MGENGEKQRGSIVSFVGIVVVVFPSGVGHHDKNRLVYALEYLRRTLTNLTMSNFLSNFAEQVCRKDVLFYPFLMVLPSLLSLHRRFGRVLSCVCFFWYWLEILFGLRARFSQILLIRWEACVSMWPF